MLAAVAAAAVVVHSSRWRASSTALEVPDLAEAGFFRLAFALGFFAFALGAMAEFEPNASM